tara:strand:+ start:461 stop:985 length:525 start_codon:yes stop_codon:yes gene_type:complete
LLISNNPNSGAVQFAKDNLIDIKIINNKRFPNTVPMEYENVLKIYKTDLILLAGFMKKIPKNVVRIYKNKIMNIHPSLLPKYGGKGFYGMKVHRAVIDSGDKESGATVHFVDNDYDRGPIILQSKTEIIKTDDCDSLAKKVLAIEHTIYPKAVDFFCQNKIKIVNERVNINEEN